MSDNIVYLHKYRKKTVEQVPAANAQASQPHKALGKRDYFNDFVRLLLSVMSILVVLFLIASAKV